MIDDFAFGRLAIIGDLLLDCYISGSVGRISPEAPVPVLLRANHTAVPGGAANVAVNAATLGSRDPVFGCVIDATNESGGVLEATSRIWPQTEMLRLLAQEVVSYDGTMDYRDDLARQASAFLVRYAPERLEGGWIDRLAGDGAPLVDYMPASSFYHIYGAGRALVLGTLRV